MKKLLGLFLLVSSFALANLENYFSYEKLVKGVQGEEVIFNGMKFKRDGKVITSSKYDKNKKTYVSAYEITHPGKGAELIIEFYSSREEILKKYKKHFPLTKFKKVNNDIYRGTHEQNEKLVVEIEFFKNYVYIKNYESTKQNYPKILELVEVANNAKK